MTTTMTSSKNTWSTIHIYGYGETQLMGYENLDKRFPTNDLTKVQAVIDYIYSLKPEGNPTSKEYHVINIFKDWKVEFKSKPLLVLENTFSIKYADLDTTSIDELATEIIEKQEVILEEIVEPTINTENAE